MRPLLRSIALLGVALALEALPAFAQQTGSRGVIPQRNTAQRVVGKRRALIVGIDEYQDQRIPQLRYATVDAMAFVGWLRSPAAAANIDTMVILLNRDATRERILDTYRAMVEETQENDELIFYYAGHGGVREVHEAMEGYLMPHDADSSNIARRGISLDDINKEVSYLPGQSPVLLILDACRSGNLFNSNQMSRAAQSLGPNIRRLVSSSGAQDSQEGDQWEGHGAFTYFLLNGLYGMADADRSGNVTLAELGLWVVGQVSMETNQAQIPEVQPFDHKWGITDVVPALRDSVARRVAARSGGTVAEAPTRGTTTPARPGTARPPAGNTPPGNTPPVGTPPTTRPSPSAPPPARPAARRGGAIRVGETVNGELAVNSPTLGDSTRFDAWTFSGRRGDRVQITMRSSAFDPYLILSRSVGGTHQSVRQDDDGGGGTDARIALELPADGDYTIVANAVRKEAVGAYSLALETVQRVQIAFRDVVQAADQHPRTQIGATISGQLNANSALLTDGSSFDAYTFEGQAGQTVEISMESTDFDAFLALGILGSDSVVARDDDGGNNSDALIVARLPRTGRYVVLANSYGRDASGAYTLGIRPGLPTVATNAILAREATAQRLRLGQTANGDLRQVTEAMTDASPFQVWYFEGRRGQRVTINMRAPDFDSYLHLGIVGTKTMVATDDDGAGGTNSRITATLPQDGMYAVIANSLRPNGRGPYTLELRDGATVDWRAMTNRDVLAVADSFPRLAMGRAVSGALSDRSPVRSDETPFQGYVFDGRRGETVQLDMEAAGFDAFLTVGRAGTDSILGNDDDGGEGTNARLTVTLPQDGRYVVMANAIGKDARGAFTLRMSAGRASSSLAQILADPPSAARMLRAGTPVQGRLGDADGIMTDRTAFQAWYYQGRAGERVTITMRSSDFDAFLHLARQGATETIDTDDDGAGGTDAKLELTLDRDGTYVIIANMLSAGGSGVFTLEVTSSGGASTGAAAASGLTTPSGKVSMMPNAGTSRLSPQAVLAMPASANVIQAGQAVTGQLGPSSPTLGDNSPFAAWYLQGRAGERVTITMRSTDFDAYLHVGKLGEGAFLATDDDSGGNSDAQLTFTFPSTGTFAIIANTFAAGSSGSYRLEVQWARGGDE
jgi:hypothetical protein